MLLNAYSAEHSPVKIWRETSCLSWIRSEAWKRKGKGHENITYSQRVLVTVSFNHTKPPFLKCTCKKRTVLVFQAHLFSLTRELGDSGYQQQQRQPNSVDLNLPSGERCVCACLCVSWERPGLAGMAERTLEAQGSSSLPSHSEILCQVLSQQAQPNGICHLVKVQNILPLSTPIFILLPMMPMSGLQENQIQVQEQGMSTQGAPFLKSPLPTVRIYTRDY